MDRDQPTPPTTVRVRNRHWAASVGGLGPGEIGDVDVEVAARYPSLLHPPEAETRPIVVSRRKSK